MSTQRKSILNATTSRQMKSTLTDVLQSVADGTLSVEQARNGLLYLITSIDNGEPNEIETWTRSSEAYKD